MQDGNPFVATFEEHADFGVAYGRTFTYLDEDGAPIDVDAYTADLTIRQDYSTDVLLTLSGVTDADGEVHFSATGAQMEFLASARYTPASCVYDVVLLTAGAPAIKLVRGGFTLHPTVAA